MSDIVHYVSSYQAFLSLLSFDNWSKPVIATDNADIQKLCQKMKIECINITTISFDDFIFRPFWIINYLKTLHSNLQDKEIYFTHTQFALLLFALIGKYHKLLKFTLINLEHNCPIINELRYNPKFLWHKLYCVIFKYFYKIDLVVKNCHNNYIVLGIDASRPKEYFKVLTPKTEEIIANTIKIFKENQIKSTEVDILIVHQETSHLSPTKWIDILTPLLKNQKVGIKLHPLAKGINIPTTWIEYDRVIPAEFLAANVKVGIIGVNSLSLGNIISFASLAVISLLNVLEYYVPETKASLLTMIPTAAQQKITFIDRWEQLQSTLDLAVKK